MKVVNLHISGKHHRTALIPQYQCSLYPDHVLQKAASDFPFYLKYIGHSVVTASIRQQWSNLQQNLNFEIFIQFLVKNR